MSFILDALKKSEVERQRQIVPGLMDTRHSLRRGGLPLWALLLGVLFAINIAVLVGVLMHHSARAPSAAEKPAVAAPAPDGEQHFSPLDAPVYAPEIPVSPSEGAMVRDTPPRNAVPPLVSSHPAARTAHHADPLLTDEDAKGDTEVLPSINELSLSGAQALPELHLDVHVFASKPSDRFVYINMRKYHEGATLAEGPVIERIRRDGVILNYQGLRFMLPRQ